MSLAHQTLFISGGSRGIGLAIALRAARDGANVVIAAKTDQPHPKLAGTIHTAAEQIREAGGQALPLVCDIRDEEQVSAAVAKTVETFGGIDILVNNASAISLTGTLQTDMKRYDLMNQINARGTYLCGQKCIPHLRRSDNPHILTLSPPLDMRPKWFAPHVAYSMAKYGMSLCTLSWAEEFRADGIAANSLWPRTGIATAAIEMLGGDTLARRSRAPEIMADAAHVILCKESRSFSGHFCIDDVVLHEAGVRDFSIYRRSDVSEEELMPDFFVPDDLPKVT
ncbi:NAD(P)-dependent oxidoreductase [Algiphilus sp. NNCM1]|uniref:SDR family oxidoreductase n=1 Tax=Algiphilus sp. TaxID=1872431 RepID=UPI001CA720E6|nr:NAD(P)-dependent oxidoreductase [Algiphilus sp.]MBY8966019.1 NAD(P)-dependent oxidoreductase [Algiphilus acroporae]MCI5062299.1 NAD(P)-dependent oxidoreductase [Algiphilus sp.]MCI5102748.1 NAD(P)-dependent oxidoreductase [Algiphilus sp.]